MRFENLRLEEKVTSMQMGEHTIELEYKTEIGEFFEKKAREELRENPETREDGLKELRKLIDRKSTMSVVSVKKDIFVLASSSEHTGSFSSDGPPLVNSRVFGASV